MWHTICTSVVEDVDAKREELQFKLSNLEWRGNMNQLLLYFSNLVAQYQALDGSFSKAQLSHMLLNVLPEEYDNTVISLKRESVEREADLDLEKVKKVLTLAANQIQKSRKQKHPSNNNSRPNKRGARSRTNNNGTNYRGNLLPTPKIKMKIHVLIAENQGIGIMNALSLLARDQPIPDPTIIIARPTKAGELKIPVIELIRNSPPSLQSRVP